MKLLDNIYNVLKSIKIAIIIIALIVILSILASIVPQGNNEDLYHDYYGDITANIILSTGFNDFYKSLIFIILITIFGINLFACTLDRMIRRFTIRAKFRPGPDIIHIGLMILIIGGAITLYQRVEWLEYIEVGETYENNITGFSMKVLDLETTLNENKTPIDWITKVEIIIDGETVKTGEIKPNYPLSYNNVNIYQNSYKHHLTISDNTKNNKNNENNLLSISAGSLIPMSDNSNMIYMGNIFKQTQMLDNHFTKDVLLHDDNDIESDMPVAVFDVIDSQTGKVIQKVGFREGDALGDFTIEEIHAYPKITGLSFVIDPGYMPVLVALIITMIGMAITFAQKIGDQKQ